jgi:hypothetical protein
MKAKDILLDSDEDLAFKDGDFFVGNSDQQHVQHILKADKGHIRQFPLLGVGLLDYVNGAVEPEVIRQLITTNLRNDNYNVKQVLVTNDYRISIDAERISNDI